MIIPRFSLRKMLIGVAILSVLSLVYGMATQGYPWAIASALALTLLEVMIATYAITFGFAWLTAKAVTTLRNSGAARQSPFATESPFHTPGAATSPFSETAAQHDGATNSSAE